MTNKLTPWFPGDVRPVRIGWYVLKDLDEEWNGWWDGTHWRPHPQIMPFMFQGRPWRGLAKNPNSQ